MAHGSLSEVSSLSANHDIKFYIDDRFKGRIGVTRQIIEGFGYSIAELESCDLVLLDLRGDSANSNQRVASITGAQKPVVAIVDDESTPLVSLTAGVRLVSCATLNYELIVEAIEHLSSGSPSQIEGLVGHSNHINELKHHIRMLANCDSSVLITGESGTGKELVAQAIHQLSSRSGEPFVGLNCAAIPAELLESELFGHHRGAFTSAHKDRIGRFEAANNGTLFLDEIGDMPLQMQAKLLRVLQEGCYEPVGSCTPVKVNVRIVAATHRDLEAMVASNTFRQDLYFRLNVIPLHIEPLRERTEDIWPILQHIGTNLRGQGLKLAKLDKATRIAMTKYRWPGNVRELANFYERLAVLAGGRTVSHDILPTQISSLIELEPEPSDSSLVKEACSNTPILSYDEPFDLKSYLEEVERNYIQQALDQSDGVVSNAAKRLGLRRTTLIEKMRKYSMMRVSA